MSCCPMSSSTTSPDRRSPRSITTISRLTPVAAADPGCRTTSRRSSSGSTSSRSTSTGFPFTYCTTTSSYSSVSRTCVSGSAYRSVPDRASSARTIASVIGKRIVIVVPSPATLLSSTEPPSARAFACTTSIPTPRPERSDTCSAVENPGCAMSRNRALSSTSRVASSTRPRARARARTSDRSMPRPSSLTRMSTAARSRAALSTRRPRLGLPAAARSSGDSIP